MNVLLLSRNHTVSEMVALAFRDKDRARLIVAEGPNVVVDDVYDVLIVDDALEGYREALDLAERLGIGHTVLLSQMGATEDLGFEHRISKPFLPSEIETLIGGYIEENKASKQPKKKRSKKKKKSFRSEAEVLNLEEIDMIKSLLEEEGLEIVNEEELAEKVLDDTSVKEEDITQNEALLEALRTMKPKKIRKLLKGATVKIEITFPGETL